jgi:hypothetical protein
MEPNNSYDVWKGEQSKLFAIISANRRRIFEDEPVGGGDLEFFKDYLHHKALAEHDLYHFRSIATGIKMNFASSLCKLDRRTADTIFVTFHLGSYRALPLYLGYLGVNMAVAVDEQTYADQHDHLITDVYEKMDWDAGRFEIVNVERAGGGIALVNEIKKRNNLVFYLDGNTGLEGSATLALNFFGKPIHARLGIPHLSHLLKLRIVPVFSYRDEGQLKMDVLAPIIPLAIESREEYGERVVRSLYKRFEDYLLRYPAQWEGWAYLQKNLAPIVQVRRGHAALRFNKQRFVPILSDDRKYLFDKETYESVVIPERFIGLADKMVREEVLPPALIDSENLVFFKNMLSLEVLQNKQ